MEEVELRFKLNVKQYESVLEWLNSVSGHKDAKHFKSYYFANVDELYSKKTIGTTLKIREEDTGIFIYFKSPSGTDNNTLFKIKNETKVKINKTIKNNLISNGIDIKFLNDNLNNQVYINAKGNIPYIGSVEIERMEIIYSAEISIMLDKYYINNETYLTLEIELANKNCIDDKNVMAEIHQIIENFNLDIEKAASKKDTLYYQVYKEKLLSFLLNLFPESKAIVIYDSSMEGVGSKYSDIDVYIHSDVETSYGTFAYEFLGRAVDIEVLHFHHDIEGSDYKRIHRIYIGDCILGDTMIGNLRQRIAKLNIYDEVYKMRTDFAVGFQDDANRFMLSNDYCSAATQIYFSLYYTMLAYLIKKDIKVLKEKWLNVLLLRLRYFGDDYAETFFEIQRKLFIEEFQEDTVKVTNTFILNLLADMEMM